MPRKKKKPEWVSGLNDDSDAKDWKDNETGLIDGSEPKKKVADAVGDEEDDLGEIDDDYGKDDSDGDDDE